MGRRFFPHLQPNLRSRPASSRAALIVWTLMVNFAWARQSSSASTELTKLVASNAAEKEAVAVHIVIYGGTGFGQTPVRAAAGTLAISAACRSSPAICSSIFLNSQTAFAR
jgi:hypothetical protein